MEVYLILAGLIIVGWLGAWFVGIAYGRTKERTRQAEASKQLSERIQDAVQEGRVDPVRVDDGWLHRPSPGSPTGKPMPPTPSDPGR